MRKTLAILTLGALVSGCGAFSDEECGSPQTFVNNTNSMPGGLFGIVAQVVGEDVQAFSALNDSGISWARSTIVWASAEPQNNSYNWSGTRFALDNLRANGVDIMVGNPVMAPGWSCSKGSEPDNCVPDPGAAEDFGYALAREFRGDIAYWALGNEPNLGGFWAGTVAEYRDEFMIPMARGVKRGNPNAIIICGELSGHGLNAGHIYDVLGAGPRGYGFDHCDVLALHTYKSAHDTACQFGMAAEIIESVAAERGNGENLGGKMLALTEYDSTESFGEVTNWAIANGVPMAPYQLFERDFSTGKVGGGYSMLNDDYTPKNSFLNYSATARSH